MGCFESNPLSLFRPQSNLSLDYRLTYDTDVCFGLTMGTARSNHCRGSNLALKRIVCNFDANNIDSLHDLVQVFRACSLNYPKRQITWIDKVPMDLLLRVFWDICGCDGHFGYLSNYERIVISTSKRYPIAT